MNQRSRLILALGVFCAARSAFALSPGETVDNFRLLDHQGGSRELYYLSDMKAVVLMRTRQRLRNVAPGRAGPRRRCATSTARRASKSC